MHFATNIYSLKGKNTKLFANPLRSLREPAFYKLIFTSFPMNGDNGKILNILLADDDPDDQLFFRDAITSLCVPVHVQMVNDGAQLMAYLLSPATVLPDILFLDLNMPLKNGFECLTQIRSNEGLNGLFIAIYSTSANPHEIEETFKGGANLFISKPNTFTGLKQTLSKVFNLDLKIYSPPELRKFVLETA
jgi:CheY-like chemotaxis protein